MQITLYAVTNGTAYAYWNPLGLCWGTTGTFNGTCLHTQDTAKQGLRVLKAHEPKAGWVIRSVTIEVAE